MAASSSLRAGLATGCPAHIKDIFLPAAVTARRQRTAGKLLLRSQKPELERVSCSTEMGCSLAGQGRVPRVRVPREELVQVVMVSAAQRQCEQGCIGGG